MNRSLAGESKRRMVGLVGVGVSENGAGISSTSGCIDMQRSSTPQFEKRKHPQLFLNKVYQETFLFF